MDDDIRAILALISAGGAVESNRQPEEDETQLAAAQMGALLRIDGLSIAEALDHPQIGPALEEIHDYWQRPDRGLRDGEAIYFVSQVCREAGHPLCEYPPADALARLIRDRVASRILKPLLARRGMENMSPILVSRTIRGTRVLAAAAVHNAGLLMRQWRSIQAGDADWDQYVDRVGNMLSRRSEKYDANLGSPQTFLRKALEGEFKDFMKNRRQIESLDEAAIQVPDEAPDAEAAIVLREKNAAFATMLAGLDNLDREIVGLLMSGRHGDLAAFGKLHGIPEGTLWSRVSRQKRNLKDWTNEQR